MSWEFGGRLSLSLARRSALFAHGRAKRHIGQPGPFSEQEHLSMQFRSIILSGVIGTSIFCSATQQANAQALTNDFTYQGLLTNAGAPVNGNFDLRFSLWDASIAGAQIGAYVPINNVTITNGLVTATLNFGVNAFQGSRRWVQIEFDATPGGGAGPFTLLLPRQELRAAPYALFALAGSGQWTPNGSNLNYTQGNVSVGTTSSGAKMTIYPTVGEGGTQVGLHVQNTDPSQQTIAGRFVVDSPSGIAVVATVGNGNGASGRAVSAVSGA
ncbi:MAG TPA: hypothetical protein VFX76_15405, partial [Roseiflexaceae bacterium]|nr:hypothetical protein [Roseiflexaceae bacterium]